MSASHHPVCLIGNSFLGAVRRAYESQPHHDKYILSFFANAGSEFDKLGITDNKIVNAPHHSGGSHDVRDYDYFVIYGDAPTPLNCAVFYRGVSSELYSASVRSAALESWMAQFNAIKLVHALRKVTDKPLYLLSHNVNQVGNIGTRADNDEGMALLKPLIRPCHLIEFPGELFLENGRPKLQYYKGSLNVAGEQDDRSASTLRDRYHLNADGGALILGAIIAALDESSHP
jgi:hypothetical protein